MVNLKIGGNLGINDKSAFVELKKLISTSLPLKKLDISTMAMSAKTCTEFCKFLIEHFNKDWNLNNNLTHLTWNDDLKDMEKLKKVGSNFLLKDLPKVYNLRLQYLEINRVFMNAIEREKITRELGKLNIKVKLVDIEGDLLKKISHMYKSSADMRKAEAKSATGRKSSAANFGAGKKLDQSNIPKRRGSAV